MASKGGMEELVRGLAQKVAYQVFDDDSAHPNEVAERVLREAGLVELLEAGQAYRNNHLRCVAGTGRCCPLCKGWDAAFRYSIKAEATVSKSIEKRLRVQGAVGAASGAQQIGPEPHLCISEVEGFEGVESGEPVRLRSGAAAGGKEPKP